MIYNSQIQKPEKTKKEETKVIIPINQNFALRKIPQKLDNPIKKKNDLELEKIAGGYENSAIYDSYINLAFSGFEIN